MNLPNLIKACEHLETALHATPDKHEREDIESAIEHVRFVLQKRGVFVGQSKRQKPLAVFRRIQKERNPVSRSSGIQIASESARKHGAAIAVVLTVDSGTVRVDSWGATRDLCAFAKSLAQHIHLACDTL